MIKIMMVIKSSSIVIRTISTVDCSSSSSSSSSSSRITHPHRTPRRTSIPTNETVTLIMSPSMMRTALIMVMLMLMMTMLMMMTMPMVCCAKEHTLEE